ncbi:adenosine receptor A3-like [Patiria miniata]|uniref:G-protein coupled receptors family 1 profile domain-containing protein n=1 Tax=Patiria miniata TaxID=46514 RepID=A0A914A1S0_PATMI|nr:adenosine receptor A3-like [Patiria miniata]
MAAESNATMPNDDYDPYDPDLYETSETAARILLGLRYAVSISSGVAVLENLLVIFVIIGTRKLRVKHYGFVVNLALGDLLFAALAIVFPWYEHHAIFALFMSCYVVSVLTILAVAINRLLAVSLMPPSRYDSLVTGGRLFVACVIIWAVSLILNLISVMANDDLVTFWIYGLIRPMTVFVIWLITAILYFVVYRKIARFTPSSADAKTEPDSGQITVRVSQTRKVLITFIIILLVSFVCWMPYSIVRFISFFDPSQFFSTKFDVAYWFAGLLYCLSAMINPVIYWGKLDGFRESFNALFCCCCSKQSERNYADDNDKTEFEQTVADAV